MAVVTQAATVRLGNRQTALPRGLAGWLVKRAAPAVAIPTATPSGPQLRCTNCGLTQAIARG